MKKPRVDEFFERIVARRAARLGISLEEARKVPNEKPMFLQAAEEIGRLQGKTAGQVLSEYDQRLRDGTYPTAECLTVDEADEYGESGVMPVERAAHVERCKGCYVLLAMSFRTSTVSVVELLARNRNT